jgi:hypothetical protein
MKKILIAVVAALSISSCSRANRTTEPAASAEIAQEYLSEEIVEASSANSTPVPSADTRKLIAKGNVEIKVKPENVDSIYDNINALIKKHNGYKSSEKQNEFRYSVSASIPSASFEDFTDALNKVGGKMSDKSINVQDVTDAYTDLISEIKSKEAALEQYRVLLKRANKISEIIEIQTKIDYIQNDIDVMNGRRVNIDRRVAYSVVDIDLIIVKKEVAKDDDDDTPSFGSELVDSLSDGWAIIKFLIVFLLRLWPFFIIGGAGYFFYKKRKEDSKTSSKN